MAKLDKPDVPTFAEMFRRQGPPLFGGRWIEKLTPKQRWLRSLEYHDAWDKGLLDDWEAAGAKGSELEFQEDEAAEWIRQNVPSSQDGLFYREDFERAFAKAYPAIAASATPDPITPTATAGGPPASSSSSSKRRATASQAEHDRWYREHLKRCKVDGRTTNVHEDRKAARAADALGAKANRTYVDNARRSLAPPEWKSSSQRRQKR